MKSRKRIVIIGASGFIGSALREGLTDYDIVTYRGRDVSDTKPEKLCEIIRGSDALINLAGKSIFGLWTPGNKKKIYQSRIKTTRRIVEAINLCDNPPTHVLNASAIGIYKPETEVDEYSEEFDTNFLAGVLKDWENEVKKIDNKNIKISILRFGIVLGKEGGAYKTFRILTKFQIGAVFNGGNQSLSFIYLKDLVKAIGFILEKEIAGTVNFVSPGVSDFRTIFHEIKSYVNALFIWNLPGFIIKYPLGETSDLVLKGHKVKPAVLLKNNFNFEAGNIETCVNKIENN